MAVTRGQARIVANLTGVGELLKFDERGLRKIESSWEGARFSFIAALLALPVYLLIQWFEDQGVFGFRAFTVTLICYALQWSLFPLALYYLCRSWGKLGTYPHYLTAVNWLTVWQSALFGTVLLLSFSLPGILALLMPVAVYLLAINGFIARAALGLTTIGAAGIVILDLALIWQIDLLRAYLLA